MHFPNPFNSLHQKVRELSRQGHEFDKKTSAFHCYFSDLPALFVYGCGVPVKLAKGLSRRKRLWSPAKAAGPFRARGGTLLLAQVLSGRRRSQLSDGTGPRACTPTCEYGRFCLHGSTQTAGYRHPTSRVFLNDFYYLQTRAS